MTPEIVRWLLIVDLFLIVACGWLVLRVYWRSVAESFGNTMNVLAVTIGAVFVVMAAAVGVNILSPIPPTPGVKVAAVLVTPLAVAVVVLTTRVLARRP